MVMNPRTHPRGTAPDFTLPRANPNPARMTDALWWLVCMRELLEPVLSENGGTYANKPGYHNVGNNLPSTDHSVRRTPDRTGPWWRTKTGGHDWTFLDAQHGNYGTIQKYTRRLVNAMRDPDDLRPDDVYAYTLGQTDGDPVVEGYNEYTDDAETSADKTHLWHRHDSFRRDIVGNYWAMWKALTIDMGWTYAEWLESTASVDVPAPAEENGMANWDDTIKITGTTGKELFEPDREAGTEVAAGTILQLSAIHAGRAARDAAEALRIAEETAAKVDEVLAALKPAE